MPLPSIAPYPLPAAAALPANRVAWKPDPARAVLLVHDMQNHFLDAYAAGSPLTEVVANIDLIRTRCASLGVPVVFSAQPGDQDPGDRGLLTEFWGEGMPADGTAPSIVDSLKPAPGDTVLTKWRYSAFVRTELDELFGDRDQLIITGVYGHIGVLATALDAFMRDLKPFVVADAVADFSAEEHQATLRHVARRCGYVLPTEQLLDDGFEVPA